jgi:microcystin-dependent protein
VGIDSGDADFDVVEETGGAKTVAITEAQLASHSHTQRYHSSSSGAQSGFTTIDTSSSNITNTGQTTATAGSGQAHPNVQPYIVCYFWKRTA